MGQVSPEVRAAEPTGGDKKSAFSTSNRGCTDVLLLLLFVAFWCVNLGIGGYAVSNGDYNALIYARDYEGTICKGTRNKIYYPDLVLANAQRQEDLVGFCVETCPSRGDVIRNSLCSSVYSTLGFCPVGFDTENYFYRCIAKSGVAAATEQGASMLAGELDSFGSTLGRAISDVNNALTPIVVVGALGSLVASFIWMVLLSKFTAIIVWTSIFAFCAIFILATAILGCYGGMYGECAPKGMLDYYKGGFIVSAIFTSFILMMICCMCSRIKLACGILSQASKAVMHMPIIIFFPIIPFVMLLCLYAYWVVVGAYLYGVETTTNSTISNMGGTIGDTSIFNNVSAVITVDDNMVNYMWMIHLFGLLWTAQFITAFAMTVIAGAVSHWYFSADKSNLGHAPVIKAIYRTFRFHLGSIAFGALIIAIIQFIRICLTYLQKKLKQGAKNETAKKIIDVVFCVIQCCLYCLEKCMKFINKNAYILVAMRGWNFCHAGYEAVVLILTNPARIGTVATVTNFVLTLGKLAVSCGMVFAAIPWIESIDDVNTWWLPCVIIGLMAYSIACVVFSTYDKSVDTILICVLEDEKLNKSTGNFYADPSIIKFLDGAKNFKEKNSVAPAAPAAAAPAAAPAAAAAGPLDA
jgi:hypothetical protein